ncbi:Lactobacillus shifted protein-like protein [Emericellopsis cladophorae]|uniref:Lactobacillus shifted protein-like protein n=1 Tax=Emericellopsis cladophorae TaxID=2686198 RepID=A0A9Q0BI12_9HYPO|nr:Lactobacillus shifted protein-like protein [Emericellopsis cladophorae]KAI6785736.1 Lactobacillus shifted protein-like protein [Emericellopsis cladophorae]
MATSHFRAVSTLTRSLRVSHRAFTASARSLEASVPSASKNDATPAPVDESKPLEVNQAPNRLGVWSRNQRPRSEAMTGPRFEQTDFDLQPQPKSAMEMLHREPVRWTHDRIVACEGGGGPAGHPKVFINTDKPEIAICGYCGLPFAHEHNRKHLESLPQTSYPLA